MNLLGLMAGLGMSFNAGQHAERTHSLLLPAGWYVVQIVNSEIKPTKKPGGARLNLQFKVMQGDFAGRVIFAGYNVKNDNPVAVQIAMEELAELSRAVNTPVWNDTQELHAKPFNLKIKVRQQDNYEPNNEPVIYQQMANMEGVVYATKADLASLPTAKPANAAESGMFGSAAPTQTQGGGFGNQPQQQVQQQQTQGFQPQQMQQPENTGFQQQQPQNTFQPQQQQVQQQQVQQNPGNVNFGSAATQQPWNQPQQEQQPQQQFQQQVQQQPVQQQQQPVQQEVQQQPMQQPVQEQQMQQQPVQQQQPQQGGQPNWAQQQVLPGTEQPVQQQQQMQQQPEVQDDIAQAAQTKTPPWKKPAQEDGAAQ